MSGIELTAEEWQALALSLRVSLWAVLATMPVAIAVAVLLARTSFVGKTVVNGLVHLPLILPPVVVGYLLLLFFGRMGPGGQVLEALGIGVSFRWTGAAIASGVMGFPLMVRAIRLSLDAVDQRLEQAASTLGAGRMAVFLTVTLPLILPGMVTGAVLGFGKSLGEFGATITFVSNIPGETRTLPLAIYSFTQVPGGDGPALRLTMISIALSMAALVASEALARLAQRRVRGG